MNPGGSVKDRIALPMIEAAERAGLLQPGGTIVEPTSGNTGVGLAQAAAVKGYRCIFVMADKQSEEKRALLRAYGAEIVVCPTDVPPDDERSYYRVSDRLALEIPGAWKPDQYSNPNNPEAHYLTTGPEIWDATHGRITHFVVALGTGGTVSGTGRFLKERNPSVVVVGADPDGSVYSGSPPHPYLTEGIGEDFWPGTYDPGMCDVVDPGLGSRLDAHRARRHRPRGHPHGRVVRHGAVGGAAVGARARRSGGAPRRAAAGLGAQLRGQALQRRLAAREGHSSAPTRTRSPTTGARPPWTSSCAATRSRAAT